MSLREIYGTEVPPELMCRVTNSVKDLLDEWRARSKESYCSVLFLDALMINVKDGSLIVKKSIYLALASRLDGQKKILGL